MAVLLELSDAINLLLNEHGRAPLDLYEMAALLPGQFPSLSLLDIVKEVADVGVKDGARFLYWEPPPKA